MARRIGTCDGIAFEGTGKLVVPIGGVSYAKAITQEVVLRGA